MTIQYTAWNPDVCTFPTCRLVYSWDDAFPTVHTLVAIERKCSVHSAIGDNNLYAAILEECGRKSYAFEIIRVELGRPKGDLSWYLWNYRLDRVLEIQIRELVVSAATKTRLRKQINDRFGQGKVVIK